MRSDDTIAAIITPLGRGGVGVIRISGKESLAVAKQLIAEFPNQIKPRYVYHGWIEGTDEVLYTYMKAPRSYTGEESVEISCHGGVAVIKMILGQCVRAGARQAEKGEFTKRAFLNGRIDLAQAEAVIELINARTEKAAEAAARNLGGHTSAHISGIREKLINMLARIEAAIDFPDDVEGKEQAGLSQEIREQLKIIDKAIAGAGYGRLLKVGAVAVIAGKTNVGKSSLFNLLVGEDRAIVTEIPGTTRDTIEEVIDINGAPIRLVDTAGIRAPKDRAEEIGIARSEEQLERGDIVILMFDGSEERLGEGERRLLEATKDKLAIKVINKIDLGRRLPVKGCEISAKNNIGIGEIREEIYKALCNQNGRDKEQPIIMSARQEGCLNRAKQALQNALESIRMDRGEEIMTIDLKEAVESLGEITGHQISENVIEKIFADFCVGK